MAPIDLMAGKIQLYQRDTSRFWQARSSVGGRQYQFSTNRQRLDQASSVAEDSLRGKRGVGYRQIIGSLCTRFLQLEAR